jgi:hypothetical protein
VGKINFLESARAFNPVHPPKVGYTYYKKFTCGHEGMRASSNSQRERGRRPPFDKEARMLRSEIDFPPVSQIGGWRCAECRSSMRLAWIEPDEKPGYDKRTFECLHCHRLDTVMVKLR